MNFSAHTHEYGQLCILSIEQRCGRMQKIGMESSVFIELKKLYCSDTVLENETTKSL